jgi:hypothetical protein
MSEIEIVEPGLNDGWDAKTALDFERLKAIVERIESKHVDVTEKLSSTLWTQLGNVCARFGEAGRTWFHKLSKVSEEYTDGECENKFNWCLEHSKAKSLYHLTQQCKKFDIDQSLPDGSEVDPTAYIPEGAEENSGNDVQEYGFFAMKNRYYKMMQTEKGWSYKAFTNFTLKIKYHIYDKLAPKRIIELQNCFGKKLTVDASTDIFTSTNNFVKFIEGLGNFLFQGSGTDLMRLKQKLFSEERECYLIDILGWQRRGFWAFSNGIFHNDAFKPCDDDGIVDAGNVLFYIPAGNKLYSNQDDDASNQKNFRHFPNHEAKFEEWSKLFYDVYGNNGMIAMCFGLSCLFSDVIFSTVHGFPLLFLYGPGSTGKGKIMMSLQNLFGVPQTPLKISEKANTDKAKIREMAQFRNAISGLEEYTNAIDDKALNTLKGIWDRLGYKRAIMDSKFGNESVPINSGVVVTGNEYPADDPLMQRIILLDVLKDTFTEDDKKKFNALMEYQEKGITHITCTMMKLRKTFETEFRSTFQAEYKELSKQLSLLNLSDRMINNVTILLATYRLISKEHNFPFTYNDLCNHVRMVCDTQSRKREIGAPCQQWWDTVLSLANRKLIKHGREFEIFEDSIMINYNLIFPFYVQEMVMQRNTAQKKGAMLDKLKLSGSFKTNVDSYRYASGIKTSGYKFAYDKIGVDLMSVVELVDGEEKQRRKEYADARQIKPANPDDRTEAAKIEFAEDVPPAAINTPAEDLPF